MKLPSVNIGWIVFLCFWVISLGIVIKEPFHSWAWELAIFYLLLTFLITINKYHHYRRELKFLREFHHLSQTMDDIRILQSRHPFAHVLEAVARIVGFDRTILFLKDPDGKHLRAAGGFNLDEKTRMKLVIHVDDKPSLLWDSVRNMEPLIVDHFSESTEKQDEVRRLWQSSGVAMTPIVRPGACIGLLTADRHLRQMPITDDDLLQLQVLSDQISITMHNHALHTEISQKAQLLEEQQARMKQELQLAKVVQDGALPRSAPKWNELSLGWLMKSARFIGGDFFSFLDGCKKGKNLCLNDQASDCMHCIRGLLIGDVCGKGIPAALIMSVVNSLFQEKVNYFSDPAEILTEVNASLKTYLGAESRLYSSAFFGFYLPQERKFCYANAGHDFPLFYQARTKTLHSLESTGTLLGIFRESTYQTRELAMEPGDRIFFYTDGLVDFFEQVRGAEDGFETIKAFILENIALNARDFINKLNASLPPSDEENFDDITAVMMVVES